MYPRFWGPDWLCKVTRYIQMVPMYASPFLLVAISADRYQAICRPMAHFRSSRYRRPNWLAAVAWAMSFVCSTPQLFVWEKSKKLECATIYGREKHPLKMLYVILFNTMAWLLPSICAASFYYCVCKAVWTSSVKQPVQNVCDQRNLPASTKNSSDITEDYVKKLRTRSCGFRRQNTEYDRKRIQTVRLTMTIIACNFFLWMPFCIVNVVQALWPNLLDAWTIISVMILGNLNSCVNPWIYIVFNKSHVFKAFCGKKPRPFSEMSRRDTYNSSNPCTGRGPNNEKKLNGMSSAPQKRFRTRQNISFNCGTKRQPGNLTRPAKLVKNHSEANIVYVNKKTENTAERWS
ncbi:unnamed protein product [Caenorhabditis auriculariae]|uniref:G-protein coupled receptors family 1 profile domain-containing protein n=1 Tax=Caenorhabditis auriculariae TaxID=2777116 RepID=A0A8S1GVA0_9PELO|nr:unnamed protein product [Caenorhabditis auriculariae]